MYQQAVQAKSDVTMHGVEILAGYEYNIMYPTHNLGLSSFLGAIWMKVLCHSSPAVPVRVDGFQVHDPTRESFGPAAPEWHVRSCEARSTSYP